MIVDVARRLPHGKEFRFLSSLTALIPGTEGQGTFLADGSEWFFAGHFPNRPIVPGVLITEALAQLAGIVAAREGDSVAGTLASIDVRFYESVRPPAEILMRATVERRAGVLAICHVEASCKANRVCAGRLTIALQRSDNA